MDSHRQINEIEMGIARYRRLALEVTDPLAACLLGIVIQDLEACHLKAEQGRTRATIPTVPCFEVDEIYGQKNSEGMDGLTYSRSVSDSCGR